MKIAQALNTAEASKIAEALKTAEASKIAEDSKNPRKLPKISQKSLFLALYAMFLAGEKVKAEEAEMVLGPNDVGSVTNRRLPTIGECLRQWFDNISKEHGEGASSQGWLEYL